VEHTLKVYLQWQYEVKRPRNEKIKFTSDTLHIEEALIFLEDIEKNARTSSVIAIDEHGLEMSKKEMKKYVKSVEDEPHQIEAYFDGGFYIDGNIGSAGIVIYYKKGNKKFRYRKNERLEYIESNNEAEYAALWVLLSSLEDLQVKDMEVVFKGDSQVVLKQLEGEWPCLDEQLNKWLDRIEKKIDQLGIIASYETIGRNENKEADALATQALREINVESEIELSNET
jgi:ribonuclease HI